MMRLWIALAALSLAGSASAENVLMKSNGLAAAAVGVIGITAGAAALAPPPEWQGYPKGGNGPQFQDDASGHVQSDCAVSDGAAIANALKSNPQSEAGQPRDGQIRLTDPARPGTQMFDSKAIYGSGQSFTCPEK